MLFMSLVKPASPLVVSFTNVNENIQYIVFCMIVKYPIYSCYVNKFEFAGWQFIQKLQHDKSLIYFTDIR